MSLTGKLTIPAAIGILIVAINVVVVVFGAWLRPYDPFEIVGGVWEPPSADFLVGTDHLGRDLLSRLIVGAQVTILVALAATIVAFTIGTITGFAAAILGTRVDTALSRCVDGLMAMPSLILALIAIAVLGSSIPVLIGVIALYDMTRVFRLARSLAVNVVAMDFVEAARLRGERLIWIATREILPNAFAPLVAEFGLRFCYAILFLSALSFLGLGIQPPNADWGALVRDNAQAIYIGGAAPLIPAAAIATLCVGVNMLADWTLSPKHSALAKSSSAV